MSAKHQNPQTLTSIGRPSLPQSERQNDDVDMPFEWPNDEEYERTHVMEARTYRRYLKSAVGFASPILLDSVSAEELKSALNRMHFRWNTPRSLPIGAGWYRHWRRPNDLMEDRRLRELGWCVGYVRTAEETFERLFRINGAVVRSCDDERGGLGISIVGNCIETALHIRRTVVMTRRNLVRVCFAGSLPATIELGAPGRQLGEIIGHDLFAGRDYIIQTAVAQEAMTIITATAPAVPFRMPVLDQANRASIGMMRETDDIPF